MVCGLCVDICLKSDVTTIFVYGYHESHMSMICRLIIYMRMKEIYIIYYSCDWWSINPSNEWQFAQKSWGFHWFLPVSCGYAPIPLSAVPRCNDRSKNKPRLRFVHSRMTSTPCCMDIITTSVQMSKWNLHELILTWPRKMGDSMFKSSRCFLSG